MIHLSDNTQIESLWIGKKVWKEFTDEERSAYVDLVFQHYRRTGYPYYPTDKESRDKDFIKFAKFDYEKLLDPDNKIIKQSMHALGLAWSYFPHYAAVTCGTGRTSMEVFESDEFFRKAIEKRLKVGDNMSDAGIRKALKIYNGAQGVSNFRPTAAAAIYKYFGGTDSTVWDMSCGYGGRLLGAIRSGVKTYIGTDPCEATYNGLLELAEDYGKGLETQIHMLGSEVFVPEKNSLGLCFTSPPYFSTEKYSDELTQSYLKFPTPDSWVHGFLRQTLQNCYHGLKPYCVVVLNIANTTAHPTVVEESIEVAKEIGFYPIDTWNLTLSTISKERLWKHEPLLVFLKK